MDVYTTDGIFTYHQAERVGMETLDELFTEVGLTDEHLRTLADSDLRVAPIAEQLLAARHDERRQAATDSTTNAASMRLSEP